MTIAVYCEAAGNGPLELIGKVKALGARVVALVEGEDEHVFLGRGADAAMLIGLCEDDCAQGTRAAQALKRLGPDAALFPATVRGRFLSAWAAAKLDTGLTADCTGLALTRDGLLEQSRPAFGGNLTADILCRERRPQLASVRPGVFPLPDAAEVRDTAPAERPDFPLLKPLLERLVFTPVESGVSLQTARVVVTGGKGVGGKKGFEKLFYLAELLGGAVGATRSAVDAGWISYAHQVGQTGVTVRPELYLAFGVSGLIQHIVGMNSARTVVAVNSDRNAPIFRCADFGVVADWEAAADAMIRHYQERKESK